MDSSFTSLICSLVVSLLTVHPGSAWDASSDLTTQALAVLEGAEHRFRTPDEAWLETTRAALKSEMVQVAEALESRGPEYAQPWKNHFRWDPLWKNVTGAQPANLDEITLSRRWMYSNRKGTEHELFAELRRKTDDYLDATYTFSQEDLEQTYLEQLRLARVQISELTNDPSDANAARLGRTLGWFEQTRQLTEEISQLRSLLGQPNLQVLVDKALVQSVMATQDTSAKKTLSVSDRGKSPKTRRFQRSRPVSVQGIAHTEGNISLNLVPNVDLAELSIAYSGIVESHCRAHTGPVSFTMQTLGKVLASKPVTFGTAGIQLGATSVTPDVRTTVTGIYADRQLVHRISSKRLNHPQSQAKMSRRAEKKAANLIRTEMDERVENSIEEIRKELRRMQESYNQFGDVFAPVVREGAAPRFVGTSSTAEQLNLKVENHRRHQFAAAGSMPAGLPEGNLGFRMHVSFINNMLGTIMGGKKFTDEYFMKYAKVLQATLPLPLMVHSRAPRWAIIADSQRPFGLTIPQDNYFQIKLEIAALELDGKRYELPTTAKVTYELVQNEFGEVYLERVGEVELDSQLATYQREFLKIKLAAFFAPILDGSGVVIPDGGNLGALKALGFQGVLARADWLGVAWNIPQEFVDQLMEPRSTRTSTEEAASELSDFPPQYEVDADLAGYPMGLD